MAGFDLPLPDPPRWIEPAIAFNLAPVAYIHDSWLDGMPNGDLVRTLRPKAEAAAALSRHLLDHFHLAGGFFDDFGEPRARLALLDNTRLESLFLYAGLALRAQEFRNEIDGGRIARLRQALGAHALDFAIKRVPFLGAIPAFDYEPEVQEPRTRLILIGAFFALSRRAWSDPAYSGRVVLKFHRRLSHGLSAPWPEPDDSDKDAKLPPLIRRLINEFMPKCQPLFA